MGLRNSENRELSEIFYIDFNIGACVSRKRAVMEERVGYNVGRFCFDNKFLLKDPIVVA